MSVESISNKVLGTAFGGQMWITETIYNTWFIMLFLTVIAVIVRIKMNKFTDVPTTRFQNAVEAIVEAMDNFITSTMGEKYAFFGNWFFGVFFFILCSNLCGLLAVRPPTADLATTATLGFSTWFMIHLSGVIGQKGEYFKGYLYPFPVFLPMNIMGAFAPAISLSFRLFGNILGGLIIMGMVYSMFPWYLRIGVPAVLHIYFDLFSGCLQAFIFTILSMTFIRDKLPD